jgi:hypothetical protein
MCGSFVADSGVSTGDQVSLAGEIVEAVGVPVGDGCCCDVGVLLGVL